MKPFASARTTATLVAVGLVAAPAALAVPIDIGQRNPAGGASATQETQIIANSPRGTYGTRQSNKGKGGGAIYGCRSSLTIASLGNPDVSTPCLRVNNLEGGKAFDFVFDTGTVGGIIQSGGSINNANPNAAPFITNATGLAKGLNADRVDGQSASQIVAIARIKAGLDADTVDGQSAGQLVATARASKGLDAETVGGQTPAQLIAAAKAGGNCPSGLVAIADSCLEPSPRAAASFAAASAACGAAGRHLPTASLLTYARTSASINLGGGEMSSDITNGQTAPVTPATAPPGTVTTQTTYTTVDQNGTLNAQSPFTAIAYRCALG